MIFQQSKNVSQMPRLILVRGTKFRKMGVANLLKFVELFKDRKSVKNIEQYTSNGIKYSNLRMN